MSEIEFDSEKVVGYFKGEGSEEDSSYIDEIFCNNGKEKELRILLSDQFNEFANDDEDRKNLDNILYRIHYDINTKLSAQKKISFGDIMKWTLRVAGVIMLPLVILIFIHMSKEESLKKEAWVEIKAPAWTRAQFSLPDGTIGWLNSNSSVKYNANFSSDRQVTLSGEAFFDVFKDKKRPFIVNTKDVVVKVLGTRFNITSYENEKNVELVLEEGKLEFHDKEMSKSFIMKPNDLVTYDKTLKTYSTTMVQPQKYLSWKEGKLIFRNDPLDVICKRLERWYNIDVEVNVTSSEEFTWRATFVDEGLEEVLSLMKRSLPVDYKIENPHLKPDDTYVKKKVIFTLRNK